eukprot:4642240-Ditylum_brightwellii.AAC.1
MKIDHKSLDFANCNFGNKPPSIPFYMLDNKKKLSPLDYQGHPAKVDFLDVPTQKDLIYFSL